MAHYVSSKPEIYTNSRDVTPFHSRAVENAASSSWYAGTSSPLTVALAGQLGAVDDARK